MSSVPKGRPPYPTGRVEQASLRPGGAVTRRDPGRTDGTSGPSPRQDIQSRLQFALDANARAAAGLNALAAAIEQFARGVNTTRDANEQLLGELTRLRELGSESALVQLEKQVARLTEERDGALRAAEESRAEAARERAFLIQEQDKFIKSLLDDQERDTAKLAHERDQALADVARLSDRAPANSVSSIPPANTDALATLREQLENLTSERQRSLELLRRLQKQRDEVQALADRLLEERNEARDQVAQLLASGPALKPQGDLRTRETEPPPSLEFEPGDSLRLKSDAPETPRADALPTARPPNSPRAGPSPRTATKPGVGDAPPPTEDGWRLSPPPAELAAAITPPPPLPPATAAPVTAAPVTAAPVTVPLKQKPDPTSRPLGGYSLRPTAGADPVDGSKPPRR